ncbi:MAG: metallopeptidase family protein [Patescibacteria group bacterium]
MHRDAFSKLADEAFASIPLRFRARLGNIVVVIEDWPTDEQNAVGAEEGDVEAGDLLGLYEGVSQADLPYDTSGMLPDRVFLFQGPIEDEAEDADGDVLRVVRETLIHEIGHHFGMDDDEIHRVFEEKWEKGNGA